MFANPKATTDCSPVLTNVIADLLVKAVQLITFGSRKEREIQNRKMLQTLTVLSWKHEQPMKTESDRQKPLKRKCTRIQRKIRHGNLIIFSVASKWILVIYRIRKFQPETYVLQFRYLAITGGSSRNPLPKTKGHIRRT